MNQIFQKLISALFLLTPITILSAQPDTTIRINAIPGMQYDKVRIKIQPGSRVELILSNKDDMSHNLVVTRPGSRIKVVEAGMALAEKGPEMNFVPDIPEVLYHIPVLSPGEEKSVTFTVPDLETILPFVCTFPGHGFLMFGAFYITTGDLPEIADDENVPEQRRKPHSAEMTDHLHTRPHPYALEPPFYYRIFMPYASPASIAVRLTDEISFCWDAGPCQLLYAWQGGFIDNSVAWKGHRNTESRLLGTIFYTEIKNNPIRFGDPENRPGKIEFQGYRLIDQNPEFHYQLNGTDVYEFFEVSEDGRRLIRNFRIPDAPEVVWLEVNSMVTSSQGQHTQGYLKLSAAEASEFSIEIPIGYTK